jgi:hypothetical protein
VATVGVAIPRTSHSGFNEGSPRSMPVGSVHHRHPPAAGTSPAKQWNTTTIHSSAITRGRTIQRRIRTHTPLGGSRDHQTLGTQPNPNSLRGQSTIPPRPTRAPKKNRGPVREKNRSPPSVQLSVPRRRDEIDQTGRRPLGIEGRGGRPAGSATALRTAPGILDGPGREICPGRRRRRRRRRDWEKFAGIRGIREAPWKGFGALVFP